MSSAVASRLQLLAAALLFSTGGAAIKGTALAGWQVAGFRSGVAAAALFLLVPSTRRGWSWRVPLVGCAYAATLVLFVSSTKLTTAANAIFLQSTAPLYLLLLGPWLLREPIRRSDWILLGVLATGMMMFFAGAPIPQRTAPDPVRGNLLGAVSGLSWAMTVAGLRWLEGSARQAGMAAVAAGNALAFLICLPWALPVVQSVTADWLIIGYLGVFQIGLAYLLVTRAVRQIPALESSLLLLVEPVLNPVWAGLFHGEWPDKAAIAGGALILAATLARMLAAPRPRPAPQRA